MGHDLDAMFSDPAQGPGQVVSVYFAAVTAASALPNPTPEQLAIGAEAAHKILDYKRDPKGIDPAAWATAKQQLDRGLNAMLYTRSIPATGYQAEQKKDYDTAVAG